MKSRLSLGLLCAASAFGQGTALPLNTWVNLSGGGFLQAPVGYDKTTWVGAPLNAALTFVNFHTRGVTSEIQDSMMSYRYDENRFTVVMQGGPHAINHSDNGHQVGVQEYFPDSKYLFWNPNHSYGNQTESMMEAWLFDTAGLTTRPVPLPHSASNANKLTRVWFANTGGELSDVVYDPVRHKALFVPDYRNTTSHQVCDVSGGQLTGCIATAGTCTDGTTTCIPKPLQLPSGAYNSDDGLIYVTMGLNGTASLNSNMYTFNTGINQWALVPTTCSGVDCNGNTPPPRNCAGFAYSTRDHKFLMIGGNNANTSCNSGTPIFKDTWTFDPVSKIWNELCNNCGYSNSSGTFDKLIYDPLDNVFQFHNQEAGYVGSGPWAFALSTPLNYGRTAASPPSLATSLNRITPSGDTQGNSFDLSISASGPNLYMAHAETGIESDRGACQVPRVYVGSIDVTGAFTWYPGGTYTAACAAAMAGQPTSTSVQSHPVVAVVGGTLMQVHEKHNFNTALGAVATHAFAQFYDTASGTWVGGSWAPQSPGGTLTIGANTVALSSIPAGLAVNSVVLISGGGTNEYDTITAVSGNNVTFSVRGAHSAGWTIGPSGYVPCFTRDCTGMAALGSGGKVAAYPTGLIDVGGVPTISLLEQDTSTTNPREHNVFVAQYANGAWTAVGGATRLNITTTGTAATYVSKPASDGASGIAVCWTESVSSSRNTMTLSPQLYCKLWNGTAWTLMGTGSLNHAAANWTYGPPSIVWNNGAWYLAFTEQAELGLPSLYVSQYNAGTNSWAPIGANPHNRNGGASLAYHPSLVADGSGSLYLAWGEQSAIGQHTLGKVDKWNGTSWTALGGDIAHDTTNGSVQDMSIEIVQGTPMVGFLELTYNNLQQAYARMWDGSAWQTAVSGSSTPAIQNTSPMNAGVAGSAYSYGFSATGVPAPTWSATGLPSGAALNSTTGAFTWASPTAGTYSSIVVTATNSAGTNTKTFSLTITTPGTAPVIQDASPLPVGTTGTAYSYTFTATGNPTPTWSGASLPSGSAISSAGAFTWASPSAGSYSFTVTATNSAGSDGPKTFALTINSGGIAPAITNANSFNCTQNAGCTIDLTATGNPAPTWSIVSGALPAGLALTDSVGGIISGVPSVAGNFSVTVKAANGVSPDATQAITITVATASANIVTIQERLYIGTSVAGTYIPGTRRTADPVQFGVPYPDDATNGITSVNVLGLSGASVGQFRPMAVWPVSGRVKWVLVDTLADVTANQTNMAVTMTGGGGNFGGPDLAADGGATITVATGAATFVIKKANFNLFDIVTIGAKTLVATGTSPGLVITGPDPTATYPANVTCSTDGANHAGVSSICDHDYSSSNDGASTVIIEENGPVKTVLKADGDLKDGSGNTFMHYTARMTFYKGKSYSNVTTALRNADFGTSNTFATAFKGHRGWEERVALAVTGTTTFSIGNETTTPTNDFLSGTDYVYIYQGMTTQMAHGNSAPPNDCPSFHDGNGYCVLPTPDLGFRIVKNGVTLRTGTSTQPSKCWADISDSTGAGVEIGNLLCAAYSSKSLEFRSGGTDVRIGMWGSENSIPYYQSWPQHSIHETWFNFHGSNVLSLDAESLKFQLPLVGHVDRTVYNNARVFEHTLLDPTEEDAFYDSVGNTSITPQTTAHMKPLKDGSAIDTGNSTYGIYATLYRAWEVGGGGNQMDFALGKSYNFLTRNMTGGLIDARNTYRFSASMGWPQSDGFTWRTQTANTLDSFGAPLATSANKALATRSWPNTWEHMHVYGADVYYVLTGDEWIREGLAAPIDRFLKPTIPIPQTERGVGGVFMHLTHLGKFYRDVTPPPGNVHLAGDTTTSNALIAQGQAVYANSVAGDLCVSGYPAGCTTTTNPRGISRVRGMFYAGSGTLSAGPATSEPYCSSTVQSMRASATFQSSEFMEGLGEFREFAGSSWSKYGESLDLMYGVSQWALSENYYDDGTGAWGPTSSTCVIPAAPPVPITTVFAGTGAVGFGGICGNGYRHYVILDVANSCSIFYYPIRAEQTVWYPFKIQHQYTGNLSWLQKFKMAVARTASVGANDEFGFYTLAQTIDRALRPGTVTLTPVTITSFTDNGSGSYTIQWAAPVGAVENKVKWATKRIVPWIGYDAYNGGFLGDPNTTANWFAATTPPNIPAPAPAGTTQSMTITGLPAGLTAPNFAVQAYVDSNGNTCTVNCNTETPGTGVTTVKTGPVKGVVK